MVKFRFRRFFAVAISAAMIFQSLPAFAAPKAAGEQVETPVSEIEAEAGEEIVADTPVILGNGETPKLTKISVNEVGFGNAEIYACVEPDADYLYDPNWKLQFLITYGDQAGAAVSFYKLYSVDGYNQNCIIPTANQTTKGKVVLWSIDKGQSAENPESESPEITINPPNIGKRSDIKLNRLKTSLTKARFNVDFGEFYKCESGAFSECRIYYRKKNEGEYKSEYVNYIPIDILGLTPNTEYEYYIESKILYSDYSTYVYGENKVLAGSEKYYPSKDAPGTFKTQKNKTYNSGDFDPDFYKYLLATYGNKDGNKADLTAEDMEDVDSLERNLDGKPGEGEQAPLKSLKGIENFPFVRWVCFQNNDLTSIDGIEKLEDLTNLDVEGNLLEKIPNLSGFAKSDLEPGSLRLGRNYLKEEALKNKLPSGYDQDDIDNIIASQMDEDDDGISCPECFYPVGNDFPFFTGPESNVWLRGGRDYSAKITIDGKTFDSEVYHDGGNVIGTSYRGPWFIKSLNAKGINVKAGDSKEVKVQLFCEEYGKEKKEIFEDTVTARFKAAEDFQYSYMKVTYFSESDEDIPESIDAPVAKIAHAYLPLPDSSWLTDEDKINNHCREYYKERKLLDENGEEVEIIKEDDTFDAWPLPGEHRYNPRYDAGDLAMLDADGLGFITAFFSFYLKEPLSPGKYTVSMKCLGKTYLMPDVFIIGEDGELVDPDDLKDKSEKEKKDPDGEETPKVKPVEGAKFASSQDNFAPVAAKEKITALVLDFSNVLSSGVDKDSLKMTVVKGSKLTTEKSVKVVSFEVSDPKAVKVKLSKDGVASIKPKKTGWVKLTMEDGNTYKVTFTVETPKPVKAAKKMAVSEEKKTLTLKDLFNIESLDQGELTITGGNAKNQAAVVVSENKLVVTPKEPDSVKLQYKYLNKKYKTNIKIK